MFIIGGRYTEKIVIRLCILILATNSVYLAGWCSVVDDGRNPFCCFVACMSLYTSEKRN